MRDWHSVWINIWLGAGVDMMRNLTNGQIKRMAEAIIVNHEVTPLSHVRMGEIATEYALEKFGFIPRRSAVLLAVKVAKNGWHGIVIATKKQCEENYVQN